MVRGRNYDVLSENEFLMIPKIIFWTWNQADHFDIDFFPSSAKKLWLIIYRGVWSHRTKCIADWNKHSVLDRHN